MTDDGMIVDPDAEFLREAARYFLKRPTGGEDEAHWSNVFNAENCERIATRLEDLKDNLSQIEKRLARIAEKLDG